MTTEFDELRARASIQEWQFESTLPLVGPLVASLRGLLHALAGKWALRAVTQQQSEFNVAVLNLIERVTTDETSKSSGDLRRAERLKNRLEYLERESISADRSILELRRLCAQISIALRTSDESSERGSRNTNEALERVQSDITTLLKENTRRNLRQGEILSLLANMPNRLHEDENQPVVGGGNTNTTVSRTGRDSDVDYFLFEMQYRGSDEEITRRHARYLKYFAPTEVVLDLGCGRGEFLRMLERSGIEARGVDADPDMVDFCRQSGLAVEQGDIIEYLSNTEDDSVGGIFLGQVVEHLPPAVLVQLIRLAHQKLKPDGCFVAETINPKCLYALTTHYLMDTSHVRPVHPELFSFLLRTSGFRVDSPLFFEPVPDHARLKRFRWEDTLTSVEQSWLEVLNHNVDLVNDFLYGNQDYAVVAWKIAWPSRLTATTATSEDLIAR